MHDENEQSVLWRSLPKYSDIDINDCVAKNKDADACLDQLIKVFDKLRREGRNIDVMGLKGNRSFISKD